MPKLPDDDLAREVAAHLELEEQDLRDAGLGQDEARSAARHDFGNVTHVHEAVYEGRPLARFESWLKDALLASRTLRRSPAFALTAVLSLALGIGSASAIFTVADQALFRLLPVEDPSRLVLLDWDGMFIGGSTRGRAYNFSYPLFREMEEAKPTALSGIAARCDVTVNVDFGAGAARAEAELVSGEYFSALGVGASLGRTLTAEDDDEPDAEPVVVLSHNYWRNRLGSNPDVVGSVVRISGYPMTVVGVAARGFGGFEPMRQTDLFIPIRMTSAATPTWDHRARRNSIWVHIFGRLAPGANGEQARAALALPYTAILRRDLQAHPKTAEREERYLQNQIKVVEASQGYGGLRRQSTQPLHLLLAMVSVLLLITCVNLATLLVIRSAQRQKELAVRASLGASRLGLARMVMTECLGLSIAGSILGLVVARLGAEFLLRLIPDDRMSLALDASLDWRILAFSASLALLTALLFGLVPAIQASRASAADSLKAAAKSMSAGRQQSRMRQALVVSQVALSLVLLATAGLFGKSLNAIFNVDSGLDVEHLLVFAVDPSQHRYSQTQTHQFALDTQRRLSLIPGVRSSSGAIRSVLSGGGNYFTGRVEGYEHADGENMQIFDKVALPGLFSTIDAALLAGRDFSEADALGSSKVAIVNETFANRFFGSVPVALGRRVGTFMDKQPYPYQIVGVVADLHAHSLTKDTLPQSYRPLLQEAAPGQITFYLSAHGDPEALARSAHAAVRELDPDLAIYNSKTVTRQIEETHFAEALLAKLSASFAALALLIASVGLYGVAAFSVTRRTREIGIRKALGAQRGPIVMMVLREAAQLVGLGAVIGAPLAFGVGKLLEAQLYGVSVVDPLVLSGAVAALLTASLAATYAPARRATTISSVSALRHD